MAKKAFTLLRKEAIKEVNGTGYVYRHEATGALLIHIANDDSNKVFNVGFKTPVTDSTGVPHIIEHSTLCGSKKYPLREPFVELIKGSLNTFLNAMTYPDSTFYPCASVNEQDFMNLMGVYLDAVFYPNIYSKKEIFLQEGWHYHLENKDDPLTINGVVYNEMKGAYSSPDRLLGEYSQASMYDYCYNYSSGGDPAVIPQLTYEGFKAFHSKYYHPSNACLYLYGNLNAEKAMEYIDKEYLSKFSKQEVDSSITPTPAFDKPRYLEYQYPVGDNDELTGKSYMSLNYCVTEGGNPEINFAMGILADILLGTEASPLKPLLLGQQLCGNAHAGYDMEYCQPMFAIYATNTDTSKMEQLRSTVEGELRRLAKEGIDKKLIEACLNKEEFRLREANVQGYPKGLVYGMDAMFAWRYGNDPFAPLQYEGMIAKLREAAKGDYFEKLIERYLINNTHRSIVVLNPAHGIGAQKDKELAEKLQAYKATLNDDQIQEIVTQTNNLIAHQSTPDSEEALASIPLLDISDVDEKGSTPLACASKLHGVPCLRYDIFSSGIAYLNLMFDTAFLTAEEIPYAGLLAELLTKLDTKHYSYEELTKEIMINTGALDAECTSIGNSDGFNHKPFLQIKLKVTHAKANEAMALAKEVITATQFTDKARIAQCLNMIVARSQAYLMQAGHQLMLFRMGGYYNPAMAYTEKTRLLSYFDFAKAQLINYEQGADELIKKLVSLAQKIFTKANITVNLTGTVEELSAVSDGVKELIEALPQGEKLPAAPFEINLANEGFATPSNVQYVGLGYSIAQLGYKYSGKFAVLNKILAADYLWNRIRVQGGAYGAMMQLNRTQMLFITYRDPKLRETYETYKAIPEYLSNFDCSDREMAKYKIGTFQTLDRPMQAEQEGAQALVNYLAGISREDLAKEREEVFACTKQDIRDCAKMVQDVINQNCIATLGNAEKVKQCADLFKVVK